MEPERSGQGTRGGCSRMLELVEKELWRISLAVEVAELVNAAGGLRRGEKVAGWVSPTGLQALHASWELHRSGLCLRYAWS